MAEPVICRSEIPVPTVKSGWKKMYVQKGKRETLDFLIRGLFLSWHTIRKVFFLYQNF